MNKKAIFGGVGAAVLLAGGVGAYAVFNKTPKQAYLYAEYKTAESAIEFVKERYADELKWAETVKTEAVQNDYELSLGVEDYSGNLGYDVTEAINTSSINVSLATDPKNDQYSAAVGATVLDFDIDDFTFFLTNESMMLQLPFQDEALEVKLDGLADMMEATTGDNMCLNEVNLTDYVTTESVVSEEDMNYLKKEYGLALYEALPEEAFTKNDDTITMELRGRDMEQIITDIVEKAEGDSELHRIIDEVLIYSDPCMSTTAEEIIDELVYSLDYMDINGEFVSKIWLDGNTIVKRSIEIDSITIEGKQSVEDGITWNYDISEKGYEDSAVLFKGKLGAGEKIKDSIVFEVPGEGSLNYESSERVDKGTRKFDREFAFYDGYDDFAVQWSGETTFDGDKMNGEHEISVEFPYEGKVAVVLKNEGAVTKGITLPPKTVDLTSMTDSEMEEYFYYEVGPKAEEWGMGLYSELENLLYYY